MPRVANHYPKTWNMADLLRHLGNISASRVRLNPAPGTATERDLIEIERKEDRLYELVEGVLVEKIMGFAESNLALDLAFYLNSYLHEHDLGIIAGESGAVRLMRGLVRMPDVCFVSWERLPGETVPDEPIADLAPDLAVEVLSRGNTKKEMKRKLKEYFLSGVRLVWYIDPRRRNVQVFTAPDKVTTLIGTETLDGGEVLPGFMLPLSQLFAKKKRRRK
jgi:Uma2 family endonuclease